MIRRFARKHALLIVFITLFMTALSTTSLYLAGIILNFPEDIDPEPTVNLIPPLKLNASVGDTAHLSMVYTWSVEHSSLSKPLHHRCNRLLCPSDLLTCIGSTALTRPTKLSRNLSAETGD